MFLLSMYRKCNKLSCKIELLIENQYTIFMVRSLDGYAIELYRLEKFGDMDVNSKSFTLIELLIVVSIIGILALIILPNFLNAQIRAKVARSQADLKTYHNVIEMYRVDHNSIPFVDAKGGLLHPRHLNTLFEFTTPVAYINSTSVFSPFSKYNGYWYYNWEYLQITQGQLPIWYWDNTGNPEQTRWMVSTLGPNNTENPYEVVGNSVIMFMNYDPTNGLNSRGLIQQHGM